MKQAISKRVGLVLFFSIAGLFVEACRQPTNCITVPPTSIESDRTLMVKVGAELEGAPVSGEVATEFRNILSKQFDQISDEDKALFLFLSAIDCYLQRGVVGEEIARNMAQLVRSRWGSQKGFSGVSPDLTPIEIREIRKVKESAEIIRIFERVGIHSPI